MFCSLVFLEIEYNDNIEKLRSRSKFRLKLGPILAFFVLFVCLFSLFILSSFFN